MLKSHGHDQSKGAVSRSRACWQYLEDAEVVPELLDEGLPLVWVVLRFHLDGPVKALQALPRDACTQFTCNQAGPH